MKSKTPESPKLEALMDELDLPRYAVVGLLELLWHNAAAHSPRGNIGKFTNKAIARRLDWNGDPDALINAMVSTKWLDAHDEHRLVVHDWPEHCEDAVDMKLARAGDTYAVGLWPRMKRLGKDEKAECRLKIQAKLNEQSTHHAHAVHTNSGDTISVENSTICETGHTVCTESTPPTPPRPSPAPALALTPPEPQPVQAVGSGADVVPAGDRGGARPGTMGDAMHKLGARFNLHASEILRLLDSAGVDSDKIRKHVSQRKDLTPDLVADVIAATQADPKAADPPKLIAHRLEKWTLEKLITLTGAVSA
ncbi:MAG: hypothetical protein AAGB26_08315 [Planctomycetota bacterium]